MWSLCFVLSRVGDDPDTAIEERELPTPGHFAGIPDYSYGIYDWLNKNSTCPSFPGEAYTPGCHDFLGWLGALNAVHFGSQATRMYAYLHLNAVALARRAAEMRFAMSPLERKAYEKELKEAELLALAYEGYAQHFLQDRWAMGHMWERWGSPDPVQENRRLETHLLVGGIAGLIHGAEAVVRDKKLGGVEVLRALLEKADPMSSPLPGPGGSAAIPMEYREFRTGPLVPAIGDERLDDMKKGTFSLSTYDTSQPDQPLRVPRQKAGMLQCAGAGWAEVIRALGPSDDGEGYGMFNAPLNADAPDFDVVNTPFCWQNWATNKSMMIGFLGPKPGEKMALIATSQPITIPALGAEAVVEKDLNTRPSWVRLAARLLLYGKQLPDGTELATGGHSAGLENALEGPAVAGPELVGSLLGFKHGGHYGLPNYLVPIGLTAGSNAEARSNANILPMRDPRGRDIQTLYGAFNGAKADYWCANRAVLAEMRDDRNPKHGEICRHLAGRAAQGTHPTYEGIQKRERLFEGSLVRSMCLALSGSDDPGSQESISVDDPSNPFWLDQGYVPKQSKEGEDEPGLDDAVGNWCDLAPVLTLSGNAELSKQNIVSTYDPDTQFVNLQGLDLGTQEGTVMLRKPGGEALYPVIADWENNAVRLDMDSTKVEEKTDYEVEVTAYDEDGTPRQSVGLFRLRVGQAFDASGRYTTNYGGQFRIVRSMEDRRHYQLIMDVPPSYMQGRGYGAGQVVMELTQGKNGPTLGGEFVHHYRPGIVERCGYQPETLPTRVFIEKFDGAAQKRPTKLFLSWNIKDPLPYTCASPLSLTVGLDLHFMGLLDGE